MGAGLLDRLLPQVRRNCLISDARHWGNYSICGLLMRMRELYLFEHGIRDGHAPLADVTEWIGRREKEWEALRSEELSPLAVGTERFGPFEVEKINGMLKTEGLLYGAGYGVAMKPVFFLAERESEEQVEDLTIYVAGREFARDLATHPAMLLQRTITARKEMAAVLLREKFDEFRGMKGQGPLGTAFSAYGVHPEDDYAALAPVVDGEIRTFIAHEMGEAKEAQVSGPRWLELMATLGYSRASVLARALQDVLADASESGTLRYIIGERRAGSLAFHLALLSGLRRTMARPLVEAYERFSRSQGWSEVEEARAALHTKGRETVRSVLETFVPEDDGKRLARRVEERISRAFPGLS
ncbi:MAG: hypothetical protein P8Y39_06020 [Nitrospirota bacterium]|jgi:hypothetical protein